MTPKAFWYRFAVLAVLLLAPYLLIWALPGTFYPASYFRGLELIKLGAHHQDVEEEIEGVKLFQAIFPENCMSYVHLGDLYSSDHQNDLAIETYHHAWDEACLTDAGMLNLIKAETAYPDLLESDLTYWIEQHPITDGELYGTLIAIYEEDGRYQQAADLSERWVSMIPDQGAAWESLFSYSIYFPIDTMQKYARDVPVDKALLNRRTQRIVDALILSTGESADTVYYRLGTAYSNNGQWQLAEQCFEKSVAIEPDRTESWVNLAISQKNQTKDSTFAIREAEKRAGDNDIVRSLMGIYWRDTDPEIAYVYWMKLAANQPEMPEWLIEGGFSLAQMGDLEGAEALYKQAITLTPQRIDVLAAYVQFCLMYEIDLSTTALEQTREIIRIAPDNPLGYLLEGQVLSATGDYLTAERMFLKAHELDKGSAEANYYLGLLYRIMNESDKARIYLQQASQSEEGYYQRAAARLLDSN